MNNAETLLVVYDMVLSGRSYQIKDLVERSGCSRRTCFRYLKCIREHLERKGGPYQLVYDRKLRKYELRRKDEDKEIVG